MLNRSEVITIEQVQSRAGLRVVSEVGTRLPLHCTSQGKVFLSAMADHEAKRVLSRRTLEPYTPKTLVTWEELFRVMQAARENGYAVEEGEYRFGLCSPSAPVRDSSGAVRYAVGVVGMFDSVRSPDFQRDIDLTCAAAAQISTALGHGRKQRNFGAAEGGNIRMEQGRRRNGNQTQIPAPRGDGLLQRRLPRKKG